MHCEPAGGDRSLSSYPRSYVGNMPNQKFFAPCRTYAYVDRYVVLHQAGGFGIESG